MPLWNDFKEAVRELKRHGCNRDQAIELLMVQYPGICSSADQALRQIQKADRENQDFSQWAR